MRAFLVVVSTPILHLFPRVGKAEESIRVRIFGSEAAVEGFDERIVSGFAWPGEVQCDATLMGPQIQFV